MIRVSSPSIGYGEEDNVVLALRSGDISGSGGRFLDAFQRRFAEYVGAQYAVAVSSGSTALHLACVAIGLEPGDEVLVSASTNIASANAVLQCGARVIPVDVDRFTWNMDVSLLGRLVTNRTKAIMPVHLLGRPVQMDAVLDLAGFNRQRPARGRLDVIEDAAQAHGTTYKGKKVGSIGDLGCFSFYANKTITTGEGGMVVTNDADLAERCALLRNLAFTTPRFWHPEVGFNYRMTNMQAALGCAQLDRIESLVAKKRAIAQMYYDRLAGVPGLECQADDHVGSVPWMFGIVVEHGRDELMARLREKDIETRTQFCPLSLQPAVMASWRGSALDPEIDLSCPEAQRLWTNGLYLPSGYDITEELVEFVCRAVKQELSCCV